MLRINVVSNSIFDGMVVELEDEEDANHYNNFRSLVKDILECTDGKVLQSWNNRLVLFTIPNVERVYGICQEEYEQLIANNYVGLKAFTNKEYDQFNKRLVLVKEDSETEYII